MPFSSKLDLASLSLLLDTIPVPVFVKDRDSRFVGMNKAFEEQLDIPFAGVENTDGTGYFPPDQIAAFNRKDREIFLSGKGVDFEEPYWNNKLQKNRISHTFKTPISVCSRELLLGVVIDISQEKEAVETLRLSEEKLRSLFDVAPLGIALANLDGEFIECNDAFVRIVGYPREDMATLDFDRITPPEYLETAIVQRERLIRTGRYGPYDKEYIRKDGARVPVRLRGVVVNSAEGKPYVWSILEDVSEEKKAEEQLRQSQKLETVGQLTAGIAHDFNNLLAVVMGNLEVLGDEHLTSEGRDRLAKARFAVERGAQLTGQLLAFSRKQELSPTLIDLGGEIRDVANMLRRTMPEDIEIKVLVPPDQVIVSLDRNQLGNALINLVVNARDAMAQGGRLSISLSTLEHSAMLERFGAETVAGANALMSHYAVVTVEDNGCGMPPEVSAKAFDPFYTTKDNGRGSGLGLSMVYGFARQSNGYASLKSDLGKGTAVELFFPMAPQCADVPLAAEEAEPVIHRAGSPIPELCRILVVEDMDDVALIIIELLQRQGCIVEHVRDARAALRLLEERTYDLLLTDMGLPGGIGGLELAHRASELRPGLRVVTMSGYNSPVTAAGHVAKPEWLSLRKPFGGNALAETVMRALRDS